MSPVKQALYKRSRWDSFGGPRDWVRFLSDWVTFGKTVCIKTLRKYTLIHSVPPKVTWSLRNITQSFQMNLRGTGRSTHVSRWKKKFIFHLMHLIHPSICFFSLVRAASLLSLQLLLSSSLKCCHNTHIIFRAFTIFVCLLIFKIF